MTSLRSAARAHFSRWAGWCLVLSCLAGWAGKAAAALPAAPAQHVLDMARAVPPEAIPPIAAAAEEFRAATGCTFWLFATSFVEPGANIKTRAKELRRAWSPTGKAALLAYDRSTATYSVTLSPEVWAAYSTPEVVQTLQEVGSLVGKEVDPLDQRLIGASNLLMQRLTALHEVRALQNRFLQRREWMLAAVLLGLLVCGAIIARILSARRAKREAYASEVFYFPDVEVAIRFGAPFGGGVIGQLGGPPPRED
ncbi:MAG: hypothetical protein KDK97_16500 [Verrucomicrobiales bacterium]|nr:hypothetical protein [Verrucomicrobiales bacterium]MCP5560636.1 hypothetical protein [Verrucomicrobiaceae bacterium]